VLGKAVIKNWLPSILNKFSNAEDDHLKMIALAYRLDAQGVLRWLEAKLVHDSIQDQGYSFTLQKFARCWDQSIADLVVSVTVKKINNPTTLASIVEYLAEHDVDSARKLWRGLRSKRKAKPELFAAATSAIAGRHLFDLWDDLWPLLTADKDFAKGMLLTFGHREQRNFLDPLDETTPRKLAELFLLLRELFPPGEDPPTPPGVHSPTARMEIGRQRDGLPQILSAIATDAAVDELLRISQILPAKERIWMRWNWREAIVATRRKAWSPLSATSVLQLVHKAENRWLTDEDDLLALVMESLERLENNLTKQTNSQRIDFWEKRTKQKRKTYHRPRDETDMSRRITTWLQSDLSPNRGIVVQREIQVQWNHRTDIEIQAVAVRQDKIRPLKIVVEVKGCWHPKVRSGHKDQLIGEYLEKSEKTHGIYLVVWTKCARWNDPRDTRKSRLKSSTITDARIELEKLVEAYDGRNSPYVVRSFVLDARL
jgi:hypothetical protein